MKKTTILLLLLILLASPAGAYVVVSSNTPSFTIDFTSENDPVTITEAYIQPATGAAIDVKSRIVTEARNYFVLNSPQLNNGDYVLKVKARDDIGNEMANYASFEFEVNNQTKDVIIVTQPATPNEGSVITKDTFNITVTFIQAPTKFLVQLIGLDKPINLTMTRVNDRTYKKTRMFAPKDGLYTIQATATSAGRPPLSGLHSFTVNARAPSVSLFKPKWGVVSTVPFDLVFKTDEMARCRYMDSIKVPFDLMKPLTVNTTGGVWGLYHKKAAFSELSQGGNVTIFVICNDTMGRKTNPAANFTIGYDAIPPIINVSAHPPIVYRVPFTSSLVVTSDDPTICKWDREASYATPAKMRFIFPGFDTNDYRREHFKTINFSVDTKVYSFYVYCENPVGAKSTVSTVDVQVDRNLPLTIESTTPRWVNKSIKPIGLSVVSNRATKCFYSENANQIINEMTNLTETLYSAYVSKNDGDYTFYVRCITSAAQPTLTIQTGKDTTPPATPQVNDSTDLTNDEYTWMTDELTGSWSSNDTLSKINGYSVAIFNKRNDSKVMDWRFTKSKQKTFTNLKLSNGKTYYFQVKAQNGAGIWSYYAGKSDGVTVDTSKQPSVCANSLLDIGMETDVDCGKNCPKCAAGKTCAVDTDCASGLLCHPTTKKCTTSTCTDKLKGPGESDVDCGGSCSKCSSGKNCTASEDCATGLTCGSTGKCEVSYASICSNNVLDPDYESDVDCGKRCAVNYGKRCDADKRCESGNDCFSRQCLSNNICSGNPSSTDADGDGVLDTVDNCPSVSNPKQEDMDNDKKGDACDPDIDGDGIPNEVELANGLNPKDPTDAAKDNDGDGLSNFEELVKYAQYKIDPNKADTDGDGYNDKAEIDGKTDPHDENSHPSSKLYIVFIIFIILIILVLLGYFGYKATKKQPARRPVPMMPARTLSRPTGPIAQPVQPRFFIHGAPVIKTPPKPVQGEDISKMKERIMREFEVKKPSAFEPRRIEETLEEPVKKAEPKPIKKAAPIKKVEQQPMKKVEIKVQQVKKVESKVQPVKNTVEKKPVTITVPVIFNAVEKKPVETKIVKKVEKKSVNKVKTAPTDVKVSVTINPEGKKG